jgi:hypothetical protein
VTIVRREHRAHFTIVRNAMFTDERLSVEAKGVLGYLLSRPHKWRVRLQHVGRTLKVGRKKLQRIFRELMGAGYVTREAQRVVEGHRFGELDYVVRDVPMLTDRPVDNPPIPRGRKGPAVPRVQKGPAYKEAPQGRNGPAYKELENKNGMHEPAGAVPVEGPLGLPIKEDRPAAVPDAACYDSEIVALFDDVAEGWELLSALPVEALAQLRERQRRGELDRSAMVDIRIRYRHLRSARSVAKLPELP